MTNWMSERIQKALVFATRAHEGVKRKYIDEPYIRHPIRVAAVTQDMAKGTEDMIIAALLHDTVEDCPEITIETIETQFGLNVGRIVAGLTNVPKEFGNRKTRKAMDLDRLSEAEKDVQTIKCIDILDNGPSIVENDKDFGPRWIHEVSELLAVMTKADPKIRGYALDMVSVAQDEFALSGDQNMLICRMSD